MDEEEIRATKIEAAHQAAIKSSNTLLTDWIVVDKEKPKLPKPKRRKCNGGGFKRGGGRFS